MHDVTPYLQSVDYHAGAMHRRTGADYHELYSAGALGLMDAATRYDAGRGVAFGTFAGHRIRGAMLDELRASDVPVTWRRALKSGDKSSVAWHRAHLVDIAEDTPTPHDVAVWAERREMLWSAVARLPTRLRRVMRWYYRDGVILREIGRRLGVTESMASRLRMQAVEEVANDLRGQG